jgi:poly-beta-1,6-N-acetyl-D-glucosamine synthase
MSLVARAVPGGIVAALCLLAACSVAAAATALAARRMIARRRRETKRLQALVDPRTGLPSRARLTRDLRILSRAGDAAGTHLLAQLELPRLGAYEQALGSASAEDLLRRMGRRLTNAVGRAGSAYALEDGRFGILARVGRGSERAFLRAATAALSEAGRGVSGVGAVATTSAVSVSARSTSAREALHWIGDSEEFGQVSLIEDEPGGAPASLASPAHADVAGAHVATASAASGTVGSALLDGGPAAAVAAPESPIGDELLAHLQNGRSDAPASRTREAPPGHRRGPWTPRRPAHNGGTQFPHRTRASHAPPRPLSSEAVRAARRRGLPPRNPPPRWLPYLKVSTRFKISVGCGLAWMALSTWVAWPWINDLARSLTFPVAFMLITGLALIPGYLNLQLVTSLLLDHPAPIDFDFNYPDLTLLVAVYNEETDVAQTITYALDQEYPAPLQIIVIDDGSSDETVNIANGFARLDDRVSVLEVPHGGKARALNAGLKITTTPLVATIDADTLLMPDALRRVVSRMLLSPDDTVAVAGSVMVRNSRESLVTAAQTWDYFLGIGSIKREQALLQGTLVAQGAFSVYDTEALQASGGWPDCIGEDIVMTWALLARGGRTSYEPTAIAFTEAPVTLRTFARQRRRWARGMIEGLRTYGRRLLRQRRPYAHSIATDIVFPFLDVSFTLGFIPGIVLAMFGDDAIVGPMTLAVLPLNILISMIMYRRQRRSFRHAGLRVRQHAVGFFVYLLGFQLVMSPVSVAGYIQEFFHATRRW